MSANHDTAQQPSTWHGTVESVHYADVAGGPMRSPTSVTALKGVGVDGDRYAKVAGTFSAASADQDEPRRQLTLFEAEVLATIRRDHNVDLAADECRMNVITRGVPLTHLVGRTFYVGDAVVRGLKLNEPCARLEEVVGRKLITPLIHRCGLFAEVPVSGGIGAGSAVRPCDGQVAVEGLNRIAR